MKRVYEVEISTGCNIGDTSLPYKLSKIVVANDKMDAKNIVNTILPNGMGISNVSEVDLSDHTHTRIIG